MRPVRNYETEVREAYICYLHDLVIPDSSPDLSLNKLFHCLYSIQFTWSNPFDANRAEDGLWLRYRFSTESPYADAEQVLTEPCTVLEMMVGLANRMEEQFMRDPKYGDRTYVWFGNMRVSLGIQGNFDSCFDEDDVRARIKIFLNREYEPNGRGGLFTVPRSKHDMRDLEIWDQMCAYINYRF